MDEHARSYGLRECVIRYFPIASLFLSYVLQPPDVLVTIMTIRRSTSSLVPSLAWGLYLQFLRHFLAWSSLLLNLCIGKGVSLPIISYVLHYPHFKLPLIQREKVFQTCYRNIDRIMNLLLITT